MELACSIDISKIDSTDNHNIDNKYAIEAPFSMQEMVTEESHQLMTPTSKAFNGIGTLSKVVEAHKGLRQEVLASTAPSDNLAQNPRLSSLLLSKQAAGLQNASEKIISTTATTRKSTQLTKSTEALPEKPKARTTTKRHTEPIKINTLKLCRDIEKKQRIRDNKPYVDLGSDDSEEMKEKIYEIRYSPSDYEGAVILEQLPEEGEMDEIEGLGGESQQEEIEKANRRWNKFIIKSSSSPKKEKYQPSFTVIPPEAPEEKAARSSSSHITNTQQSKAAISRDMIAIRKLFEKETEPTIATERTPTTIQSYRLKLNTTPRKTTPRASIKADVRIDQLMMLDSAWNGLETREDDSSSEGRNDAILQGRDSPLIKRSQSLENLQGGRKIRQSIQAIRPMVSATQSEESSPVLVKDRHGSVSSLPRNAEKVLKILDVNFPFKAPETGKMINIKDLIENNRPNKSGLTSPEKKRRGLDNIFGMSPQVNHKITTPMTERLETGSPKKEKSPSKTFRVIDLEKALPDKSEAQRASSHKYLEGIFTKTKTTVVQKKELSTLTRKDNGLARK